MPVKLRIGLKILMSGKKGRGRENGVESPLQNFLPSTSSFFCKNNKAWQKILMYYNFFFRQKIKLVKVGKFDGGGAQNIMGELFIVIYISTVFFFINEPVPLGHSQ